MSRARCRQGRDHANGVKIVGHLNVPGRVAASASLLYAKNLYAFLETMVDKDLEDDQRQCARTNWSRRPC
jgi:NAD/NADP transhydrogenase alpha subunit